MIIGHVITGSRVESFSTDELNEVRELVRSVILRRQPTLLVDLELDSLTLIGISGHGERVIESNNMLVVRFLLLPIECANRLGTLEEHMLEVVGKARSRGRFINRPCAGDGSTEHIGLVMILP